MGGGGHLALDDNQCGYYMPQKLRCPFGWPLRGASGAGERRIRSAHSGCTSGRNASTTPAEAKGHCVELIQEECCLDHPF